jgi:hypothetical protein
MAAKKKKTGTKTYGNKTKFVLGLSRDLSAKQVVDEAKKQGITITEAHVYKIRSTAKAKTPKSAGKAAAAPRAASKAGTSSSQSKRDFVLSFGPETKASEILKKAKDAGIGLSKAYLYTIRSAGGASQKRGRKPGVVSAPAVSVKASAGRGRGAAASGLEAQFIDAAIDLGLSKAGDLLQRLRARLKDF